MKNLHLWEKKPINIENISKQFERNSFKKLSKTILEPYVCETYRVLSLEEPITMN